MNFDKTAFVIFAILGSLGCGPKIVDPGALGGAMDPKACPVGSTQDFSASAKSDCNGNVGLTVKDEAGNISAACVQANGYAAKCVVTKDLCKNGAKKLTRDELDCADLPPTATPSASSAPTP
jgi:hypothetical protein